jgi:WD40 repeat protein
MHHVLLAAWSLTLSLQPPHLDGYGDPLPPHALARLGSLRFQHDDAVYSVAFSPDGSKIVTVSGNRKLWIWDRTTGKPLLTIGSKEVPVYPKALFLPDGKHVVAPTKQGLTVFDAATGKEVRYIGGEKGEAAYVLALSPDGKKLASGAWHREDVRVWDVAGGKELLKLPGHPQGVNAIAFSPDGGRLAVGCTDGTARIWNLLKDDEPQILAGHERTVEAVAFLDANTLMTGSFDRTLRVWDLTTGKTTSKRDFRHVRFVLAPDGKQIAPRYAPWQFHLCDPVTTKEQVQCGGHLGWIQDAAYSADGKFLATVGDDRSLRLWNPATGAEVRPAGGHNGLVSCVAFLPDNETLVTGGWDKHMRLWEARTGKEVRKHECKGVVTAVHPNPDGKLLASCGGYLDHAIYLVDADSGKVVHKIEGTAAFWSVQFSADGKRLTAATMGQVLVWETGKWALLHRVNLPDGENPFGLAVSPDAATMAVARAVHNTPTEHAELIDVATGKLIRKLKWPGQQIAGMVFSPDGKRLAAGGSFDEPVIGWWDVSTGTFHTLEADVRGTFCIAFSPDGRLLASAGKTISADPVIRLWDTQTGKVVARLPGHTSAVWSLAFSPNGKLLASASADRTALVWDLSSVKIER